MRAATPLRNSLAAQGVGRARGLNLRLSAALICLAGFGANAFGRYYLFLPIALALLIVNALRQLGGIQLDFSFVMLVLFAIAYSLPVLSSPGQDWLNLLYPVAYLVGLVAMKTGGDPNTQFRRIVLTVVAGVTLHGVLNAVTNVRSYGWVPVERALPDYWTQAPLTATLQATLFIPIVGIAYYGLAMRQQHRSIVAILTALALIIALAYNLVTASRTIFVVMLLTLVACTLVPPGRRLPRMAIFAGTAVAIGGLYWLDALGIRSLVESSALMGRYSSGEATGFGEDPRLERWGYVIHHFWDHMGGGLHFRSEIGYVHNLWLDAYDVAGILALLALSGFTFGALALLWRVLVLRRVPVELKVLVVGLWVALIAQFMTEPILDGMPMLFAVFCVFCGAAAGLVRDSPATEWSRRVSRIAT